MKKNLIKTLLVAGAIVTSLSMTGCSDNSNFKLSNILDIAGISEFFNSVKGELVGQEFTITSYDDYGTKTNSIKGTKVSLGLLENSANYEVNTSDFKSEVLEITINGDEMLSIGQTILFEETGVDAIEEFSMEENIEVSTGGGFVPVDKYVNNIKNFIGKSKTIIISSQLGTPIAVYQGESVKVSIPEDLPKTTRITIDGKSLYIHRANYQILDSNLLK